MNYQGWEAILTEHSIEPTGNFRGDFDFQLELISVYFNEPIGGRYAARLILFDLQPGNMDSVRVGLYRQLF